MSVTDLTAAGRVLYGHGWQTRLAEALMINPSTVRRWVAGQPVPGPAVVAIRCLLCLRERS